MPNNQTTPLASRRHVAIFGDTNAGKSTLFNKFLGQNISIISDIPGTTTDPVTKAAELIPYGPITLIDTAGLSDTSELGRQRMDKTAEILDRADFILYVADASAFSRDNWGDFAGKLERRRIEYLLVFSKCDLLTSPQVDLLREEYPDAVFITHDDDLTQLKSRLAERLSAMETVEDTIIGNLLPGGSKLVMVVPVDSEAPKGRLILPQVQLIRDCLDHGITCVVTHDSRLIEVLDDQDGVDLVVCDSQIFGKVAAVVPETLKLTSFSMLLANKTGHLAQFIEGTKKIPHLMDGANILMAEACTHNHTHEDIGYVKIPAGLRKKTGKELNFEYAVGHDFPKDIEKYDLIVHCGGCMINARAIANRLERCRERNVPITNYGVLLAYLSGIMERSSEIFIL